MGMPRLQKCCFCIDLKSGNIILGMLNAILSFGLFITMIVTAVEFGAMERDAAKTLWVLSDMEDIEVDARLSGLYAMSVILVFMFLAKFLFDIFFIYGVYTEHRGIIKAYYIMWTVFILLSMFVFFSNSYYYGIKTILAEVFYIAIDLYMVLVSYSLYVEINTREEV
ncbi:hypothetical protein MSG28_007839 [Choristoneura fumiferana]|uniref:Uncharacterized protein n=1 Tax=Choristoneura fumiferana TaxID=7141 RepID=A0ACC0J8Y7_CHOFU|nr:hypothetical protein MSG28_007839 [Choristoneura fumiferana]